MIEGQMLFTTWNTFVVKVWMFLWSTLITLQKFLKCATCIIANCS